MIEFVAHASSSRGNLYEVRDSGARLAIECGVKWSDLRRALGHSVTKLDGVLLSHHHGDHSRCVKEVLRAGVNVYASQECWSALGGDLQHHHRAERLVAQHLSAVGPWDVVAFDVVHDAEGAFGFLIEGPSGERLVYACDTSYVPNRFAGLNVVAIECNWSSRSVREAVRSGRVSADHVARVVRHHMSLGRVLDMLRANDLSGVREIHLLHLSDGHSDEEEFREAVRRTTGKPVYAAPRDALTEER